MERAWLGQDEVGKLFDEHAARAFRYARALGLSHADADDVVAESFLRVLRSRGAFRGDAGFPTWLFRIVGNQVRDVTRASSRRGGRHEAWGARAQAVVTGVPDGSAEEKETRGALAEALALLGPDERAALILVTAGELSYREAAAVEGVSATALASRVFRARRAIRKHLAALGLMPDGPDGKRFRPTGEV